MVVVIIQATSIIKEQNCIVGDAFIRSIQGNSERYNAISKHVATIQYKIEQWTQTISAETKADEITLGVTFGVAKRRFHRRIVNCATFRFKRINGTSFFSKKVEGECQISRLVCFQVATEVVIRGTYKRSEIIAC